MARCFGAIIITTTSHNPPASATSSSSQMLPSHPVELLSLLSSYSLLDTRPLLQREGLVDDCTFGLVDRPAGMIKEGLYIALYAGEAIEVIYYRTRYMIIIDAVRMTVIVVNRRSRGVENLISSSQLGTTDRNGSSDFMLEAYFSGRRCGDGRVHQGWLRTHTDFLYPGVPLQAPRNIGQHTKSAPEISPRCRRYTVASPNPPARVKPTAAGLRAFAIGSPSELVQHSCHAGTALASNQIPPSLTSNRQSPIMRFDVKVSPLSNNHGRR